MKSIQLKLAFISIIILFAFGIWRQFYQTEEQKPNEASIHSSTTAVVPSASNVSGSFEKKLFDLQTYLKDHPQDSTHLMLIAHLYQDSHQPKEAVSYYKRLIEVQQKNPQHWLDFITVLAESGDWKQAEEVNLKMLTIFKTNTSAQYNLGAIYANQGKMEEAKRVWSTLINQPDIDSHVKHLVESGLAQLNHPK